MRPKEVARLCRLLAALLLPLLLPVSARAADDVPIGVIYPPDAALARAAVETALGVVNGTHPPLPVLMGNGGGLERLGGAHLRASFADAADRQQAEAEAERLVTAEHVAALLGGATPEQGAGIRAVATRHALPYISLDRGPAVDGTLTWGFNLSGTAEQTAAALFQFLHDHEAEIGHPVHRLGLVYEDRPDILEAADGQRRLADDAGLERVVQLNLRPDAAALATEAEEIAEKKPDAILATLGAGNAILLVRTLAERHVATLLLAPGGGVEEPAFLPGLGTAADGVFAASGFAPDSLAARPGVAPLAALFQARSGAKLDAASARVITSVLLLANVIDRAGTTKPIDLRTALMATDTEGDKLPMAWQGIRFDDAGQNVLAIPAIRQVQSGVYRTVAPEELATAKPIWK